MLDKAIAAWGEPLPDWVRALAEACDTGGMGRVAARLGLSSRACHGVLKIARTIADLEGKDSLDAVHILEAVQHRRFGDDPYDIFVPTSSFHLRV
jgi:hypothetical protein